MRKKELSAAGELFVIRPARETKADVTTHVARQIVDEERRAISQKSEKLKALRLRNEKRTSRDSSG